MAMMSRMLLLLALVASAAHGAERFGGSVALTSDYVYRGISHSRGHVAVQAGAHAKLSESWRAGVWGSTTDHNDPNHNSFELDGFIAYGHAFNSDWQVRAAFTHYAYLNDDSWLGSDYDEFSVGIDFRSRVLLTAAWLPNARITNYYDDLHGGVYATSSRESSAAIDINFIQPIAGAWSAVAGAGYYDVTRNGYAYGDAGITATYGPVDLELLYIKSEQRAAAIYGQLITGSRWSASVRYKF